MMIKTIKNILWLWVFKEIYDTKLEIERVKGGLIKNE
jgi:hypothetical protein